MWGWSTSPLTFQQERKDLNCLMGDLIGYWEELWAIRLLGPFRRGTGRLGVVPVYEYK